MTPLDIEILLHYHCSGDEFPRLDAPACRESVDAFLRDGILRPRTDEENNTRAYMRAYEPTERGRALVEHLCDTPYPQQIWVRPTRRCPGGGICERGSCNAHGSCDRI